MMLAGATYREIAALSKLLDTYMNDSGELGIDTNGYAEFLDHCYICPSDTIGIYVLSNTVTDLMLYRQNVTEKTLINHGAGYGNSEINSEEDDKKVRYNCFISDSLMMICNYYNCINVEQEHYGHLLMITGEAGYDKLDSITIDVPYAKESILENMLEIKPITIYLFDDSLSANFDGALNNTFEGGKKDEDKEVVLAGVKIMKDLAIDTAGDIAENLAVSAGANESLYGGGENTVKFGIDLFGLSQVREETIEYNQQLDGLINAVNYKRTLTDLAAGGTVCQYGDDILINNRMIDERELLLRVNYYNAETGSNLSLEELEQQLRNYELSSGNTEDLKDFCKFVEEDGMLSGKITSNYNKYGGVVLDELTNMQTDIDTATREQLEMACQKALGK